MSDDSSYMSFLNKANADPKAGSTMEQSESTSQRRSNLDPTSTSNSDALPASLQSLPDVTYTSDTDSAFEPTLLSYAGSELPSAKDFAKSLSHSDAGDVEELSIDDFDPRGEYKEIISKVEQAGKGRKGVKIFRVQRSSTKVEYYVLTVGERALVGVVTRAVES